MSLVSVGFLAFVAIACAVGYFVPSRARYAWVFICNCLFLLFFSSGAGINVVPLCLMLGVALVTYLCGLGIQYGAFRWLRGFLLTVGLLCSLLCLFALKYTSVISGPNTPFLFTNVGTLYYPRYLLPLGFVAYGMQGASYLLDVFKGKLSAEENPLRYTAYFSFFSALAAGPVNLARNMLPVLQNPSPVEYANLAGGAFRVLWGVFKKMVLSALLAEWLTPALQSPASAGSAVLWLALPVFAFYLYIDFSACSDIAIGAAAMLGIPLAENFDRPFTCSGMAQLWGRWHKSVLLFWQEYIQQPLLERFSRQKSPSRLQQALARLAAFVLFALWLGPDIWFVVWGLVCGLLATISFLSNPLRDKIASKVPLYRAKAFRRTVQSIWVYLVFSVCCVFFAAGLYSISPSNLVTALLAGGNIQAIGTYCATLRGTRFGWFYPMLLGSALLVLVVESFAWHSQKPLYQWVRSQYFFIRWPLYYIPLAAMILFANLEGAAPFLYQYLF